MRGSRFYGRTAQISEILDGHRNCIWLIGTRRIGNPFALPMSALTALRFDADLGFYERIGAQTFNNLTIDVGGANDERFLMRGFSGAEANGTTTFRWSSGPESTLIVPVRENCG